MNFTAKEMRFFEKMAEARGIKASTFHSRLDRGWGIEEALITPLCECSKCCPKIKTRQDLALHNNDRLAYMRSITGETPCSDPIVEPNIRKRAKPGPKHMWTDHMGNVFECKRDMCDYWGITKSLFDSRTYDGWPVKDALEKKPGDFNFTDHNGNTFKYLRQMCGHYGIPKMEFKKRIDEGWTLEEALELPWKFKKD